MNSYRFTKQHLGIGILLLGVLLILSGCGKNEQSVTDDSSDSAGTQIQAKPAAKSGENSLDGQTADISFDGTSFSPTKVSAKAGVLTLRLTNKDGNPVRIAVLQGDDVLAESGPAAGSQTADVTIPVEAGITYEYVLADTPDRADAGQIVIDSH